MKSVLLIGTLIICCLSLPVLAQLDSSALRAKYGTPLNRETFRMAVGYDVIVDYGASNQVCKIQVPALMPTKEKVARAAGMKQRMYDFLADLVPPALRGKEVGRMAEMTGTISVFIVEYEQVTMSEFEHANDPFGTDNTITVTFKNNDCQNVTGQ